MILLAAIQQPAFNLLNLVLLNALTVVLDNDLQKSILSFLNLNHKDVMPAHTLKAVKDSVFDKWLEQQLMNFAVEQFLWYIQLIRKCIFQSGLLKENVLLQPFHFFPQRYNAVALINAVP